MKSRLFQLTGLATLFISAGWAQLAIPVNAKIPFDFTAGDIAYKAGEYSFVSVGHSGVIKITPAAGGAATVQIVRRVTDYGAAKNPNARLLFNRYGNQYFLENLWSGGEAQGLKWHTSKKERELAAAAKANAVLVSTR